MEILLQYLDDIDDLLGAFGLLFERIRRLFLVAVSMTIVLACIAGAVLLALAHPPAALATCVLLVVTLVYRIAVPPMSEKPQAG